MLRAEIKSSISRSKGLIAAFIVVIAAIIIRYIGLSMPDTFVSHFTGMIRSLIYIGLFSAWGVSIRQRIMQKQVRRYMTAVAALMVGWMAVRTVKYLFAMPDDFLARRMLWYSFYIFMLTIPAICLLVSLSLGKPENYRLPKWVNLLFIPTAVLILFALTNDMHQLVFIFPDGKPWSDHDYTYGLLYWIITGWEILCAVTALITILMKCRIPHSKKYRWLPFVPFAVAILYCLAYVSGVPWLRKIAGDLPAFLCLFFAASLESCIRCGLIQSNTRYAELFRASDISAQITDTSYAVRYAANNAQTISADQMRNAEPHPLTLPDGNRLHNMPVDGGHAIWTEDISELLRLHDTLAERKEELQERNALLQHEYEQEKEHKTTQEQNRLYDLLQSKTQRQLNQISRLTDEYQHCDDAKTKKQILLHIVLLGSFIKRRKEFVLSIDSTPIIPESKLTAALQESYRALAQLSVRGSFSVQTGKDYLDGKKLALAYDFFEDTAEAAFDTLHSINVRVCPVGGILRISIFADCVATFASLSEKYPQSLIQTDEDGTTLVLPLEGGDGK